MSTRRFVVRAPEDLGRTIGEARRERRLTQAELAQAANLDRTYLARMEAGQSTLHIERTLRLFQELGLSIEAEMSVEADPSVGAEDLPDG
jgi:transcriptional regulator with XRE-family HTH domain